MPDSTPAPVTAQPHNPAIDGNIARIRAFFRQSGWSLNRMAREAGVAWSTIQGLPDDPTWNPTATTLRKLEAVVPVSFVTRLGGAPQDEGVPMGNPGARGPEESDLDIPPVPAKARRSEGKVA